MKLFLRVQTLLHWLPAGYVINDDRDEEYCSCVCKEWMIIEMMIIVHVHVKIVSHLAEYFGTYQPWCNVSYVLAMSKMTSLASSAWFLSLHCHLPQFQGIPPTDALNFRVSSACINNSNLNQNSCNAATMPCFGQYCKNSIHITYWRQIWLTSYFSDTIDWKGVGLNTSHALSETNKATLWQQEW